MSSNQGLASTGVPAFAFAIIGVIFASAGALLTFLARKGAGRRLRG